MSKTRRRRLRAASSVHHHHHHRRLSHYSPLSILDALSLPLPTSTKLATMVTVSRCSLLLLCLAVVLLTVCVDRTSASYGGVMDFSGPVLAATAVGSEMEMGYVNGGGFGGGAGDEVNRRMLATYTYISYASLSKARTPCPARSGKSYYTKNCAKSAKATPYTRGCTTITRCARA